MEIVLKLEQDFPKEENLTKEQKEEFLLDSLFEVCEDWVIRGQQPDLELKGD